MTDTVKESIIKALSSGEFVSGQQIAEQLSISRTAVSNNIKALIEMGLDIYSVTGKGYQLSKPLDLLSQHKIDQGLNQNIIALNVEVFTQLDSTNNYLLSRVSDNLSQGHVCLAEFQSAGRGRRGRQWISPFGSQLYLSMYWYLEQGLSAAMGLSIVAALAVSDAIFELTSIQVQLKWPNDIYLEGVKLAGILIDLEGQALEPSHSVIGIGLNIDMPSKSAAKIDQDWTDLQTYFDGKIDRNLLASKLINCLFNRLTQHQNEGLSAMLDDWHKHDLYLQKQVKLITGEKSTYGICHGVNSQGALMLEIDGEVKAIYGGEVSLRGMK